MVRKASLEDSIIQKLLVDISLKRMELWGHFMV